MIGSHSRREELLAELKAVQELLTQAEKEAAGQHRRKEFLRKSLEASPDACLLLDPVESSEQSPTTPSLDATITAWNPAAGEGTEVVVRVADTGMGIAPDMLAQIFDLFVQGERRLERSVGGVGVGLTLVRRLVELHGGTVQAFSQGPGRGSEFIVRLPALPTEGDGEDRQAAEDRAPSPAPAARRVLIVDDNVDAADSLGMLLRLSGQDVQVAYDGPGALRLARSFRPQLVLLDVGMPGMDGYEVARQLRQQPGLQDAVLVAVTGWGQEEDRRQSHQAGFDYHLVKPIEPEALQEFLARLQ